MGQQRTKMSQSLADQDSVVVEMPSKVSEELKGKTKEWADSMKADPSQQKTDELAKEYETQILVGEEEIRRLIKAEEVEAAKVRNEELRALLGLIKDINVNTHDAQENQDMISEKIDKVVAQVYESTDNLLQAKESKRALQKKRMIVYGGIFLVVLVVGLL